MSREFSDQFARIAALKPARSRYSALQAASETSRGREALADLLGAKVARNRYGEHVALRRWFSSPAPAFRGKDISAERAGALELLLPRKPMPSAHTRSCVSDPAEWLFLDTETTGLAGGTGTYAFLVGVAWWDAGGLEVEQFFMRDYSEEHSLLLELSKRLAKRRVLVTFNGKSFDWPLLETRYTMTRAIAPRAPKAHLDLLHPARQLWRLRLGSVRLVEIERRVLGGARLGWDRSYDVDSALIPQIYFDYLCGGPAEPLVGVFQHNQMDLRGLAALAGKLLELLAHSEDHPIESDPLELYGLSRLLRRTGLIARARQAYEQALAAGLPRAVSHAARRELALLAKRERDFSRATALWEELLREGSNGMDACEQLAIYYEHHARQPRRAAQLTERALSELRTAFGAGHIEPGRYRKFWARLEHRLARLARHRPKDSDPLFELATGRSDHT